MVPWGLVEKTYLLKREKWRFYMHQLKVAVPTTTIIAQNPADPFQVAVFRSGQKHSGKLVLPGGRVKVGKDNYLTTGIIELKEELGMDIISPKLFCISDAPDRDIRDITAKKLADGGFVHPELDHVVFSGYFCFDVSIYGISTGTPKPDGKEGIEAMWYDVRQLNSSEFALDHGKLLLLFAAFLYTGQLPPPLGIL